MGPNCSPLLSDPDMAFPKEQLLFGSPECISLSPWQAEKMFSLVRDALHSRLDQVEWMDEQTRQEAKDKACVEDTGHCGLYVPEAPGEWMGVCTCTYFDMHAHVHDPTWTLLYIPAQHF